MWVGSSLELWVHSAQSAIAFDPSELDWSQMVVHQPTVSEVQPIMSGKQKQGLQMAQGLRENSRPGTGTPNDVNTLCVCPWGPPALPWEDQRHFTGLVVV